MRTIISATLTLLLGLSGQVACAQGVKDPSTPNSGPVYRYYPPPEQPSRPTATPNIPPASAAPPLGVRRIHPYRYRSHQHRSHKTVGKR
jgi:hypothetical protein